MVGVTVLCGVKSSAAAPIVSGNNQFLPIPSVASTAVNSGLTHPLAKDHQLLAADAHRATKPVIVAAVNKVESNNTKRLAKRSNDRQKAVLMIEQPRTIKLVNASIEPEHTTGLSTGSKNDNRAIVASLVGERPVTITSPNASQPSISRSLAAFSETPVPWLLAAALFALTTISRRQVDLGPSQEQHGSPVWQSDRVSAAKITPASATT